MSSSARGRDAPKLEMGVEDSTLADQSTIRAILLPKSKSAAHSLWLEENISWVSLDAEYNAPPSPSSSDDEGGAWTLPSLNTAKKYTSIAKKWRNGKQAVIVLRQSQENEKFTFGTALNSDVVLQHPDSSNEDYCYINLLHLELYPDPDCGAIHLYNYSTSIFAIRSLLAPQLDNKIATRQKIQLSCGSWLLGLGKGLDFEIRILPHTPEHPGHNGSLISPVATSLQTKLAEKAFARQPLKRRILEATVPRAARTETAARAGKKILKADHTGERAAVGPEDPTLQPLSYQSQETAILGERIGKTRHTLVFKGTRNDMVVAVKMCRKPEIKSSATTWKNELDILQVVHHPSIIKLVHYNAANLSLELEYIGPDLTQYADGKKISRLSEDLQHRVWKDITCGLDYLHSKKIIHLDIKPQNILLGDRAVLCDFGCAFDGINDPLPFNCGTPSYVPPEFLSLNLRGFPGDIWAFGVTLLFVFGLTPLPNGEWKIADAHNELGASEKMTKWLHDVEKLAKNIPEPLSLLRSMLTTNPMRRITAAQLVTKLSKKLPRKPLGGKLLA